MKTWLFFLLISPVLVVFAAEKKKSSPQNAPGKNSDVSAVKKSSSAVPAKPVIPEKKLPFELWMTAHRKALEAAEQKKYDEALALFDEAIKEAARGVFKNNSLYSKARLLAELQRYDEALQVLNAPVTREQRSSYHRARCAFMAGEILMKKGDLDQAENEFQKAADSGMRNWIPAESVINLGKIAALRKDEKKAEELFKSVMNDEKYIPGIRGRALIAIVEMFRKNNRNSDACALLDKLYEMEQIPVENAVDGVFIHYEILVGMKDFKGARALLDKALAMPGKPNPYTAGIYSRMAELFFLQKRYRDAQNMIRRAKGVRGHEWGYNRDLHRKIDEAVARENRERKIRERQARIEKERKARFDRERKIRQERERKARQERERKARFDRERKARLVQLESQAYQQPGNQKAAEKNK